MRAQTIVYADDARRGPPGEVLGIALDDARIQLSRRLHPTLIGRERGWLEDRPSRVGTPLQIGLVALRGRYRTLTRLSSGS